MEVADEGVLFLDEISSMPMDMQAKLLRAIEERAFRRVGGTTLIKIDGWNYIVFPKRFANSGMNNLPDCPVVFKFNFGFCRMNIDINVGGVDFKK